MKKSKEELKKEKKSAEEEDRIKGYFKTLQKEKKLKKRKDFLLFLSACFLSVPVLFDEKVGSYLVEKIGSSGGIILSILVVLWILTSIWFVLRITTDWGTAEKRLFYNSYGVYKSHYQKKSKDFLKNMIDKLEYEKKVGEEIATYNGKGLEVIIGALKERVWHNLGKDLGEGAYTLKQENYFCIFKKISLDILDTIGKDKDAHIIEILSPLKNTAGIFSEGKYLPTLRSKIKYGLTKHTEKKSVRYSLRIVLFIGSSILTWYFTKNLGYAIAAAALVYTFSKEFFSEK